MPYQGETAANLGHVAAANSDLVAKILASYEVVADDPAFLAEVASQCFPLADLDLPVTVESVTSCLSIDGSRQQDVVDDRGAQGASVGYVRIGGCFTDLAEYRTLAEERFIDPTREAAARLAAVLDFPLPGNALRVRGYTKSESWRVAVNLFLEHAIVTDDSLPDPQGIGVSLAEAILLLHGAPGAPAATAPIRTCPSCGVRDKEAIAHVGLGGGRCPECSGVLLLVDSLNLETATGSETAREAALTFTMNTMERLALVAFIDVLAARSLDELAATFIVADGPLAAFGPLASLTRPLRRYLERVGDLLWEETGRPLLVAGVEKSGEFVSHGETIVDLIPRGSVMRLTNDYIAEQITGRNSSKPYGVDHLYGRRFYYRRNDGLLLTVTVPSAPGIEPWSTDPESEDFASYPVLRPALELLESMRCVQFDGAILPLVFAHQVSALPLGTGQTVLTRVAQDFLGLDPNTRLKSGLRKPWQRA